MVGRCLTRRSRARAGGLFHAIKGTVTAWQIGIDLDIKAALEAEGIGSLKLPAFEKFFQTSAYGIRAAELGRSRNYLPPLA